MTNTNTEGVSRFDTLDLVSEPEEKVRVRGIRPEGDGKFLLHGLKGDEVFLVDRMDDGFLNLYTPEGEFIRGVMYGSIEIANDDWKWEKGRPYTPERSVGNWLSMALFVPDSIPRYSPQKMREGMANSGNGESGLAKVA
ncbi:MAG: hypothetical protein ABIG28_02380 [archaeon]